MSIRIVSLYIFFCAPYTYTAADRTSACEKKALYKTLVGTFLLADGKSRRIIKAFTPPNEVALRALLEKNPSLANCSFDFEQKAVCPLYIASLSEYIPCELVSTLLDFSADINTVALGSEKQRTVLMDMIERRRILLHKPCTDGCKRLLEEYIDFDFKDKDGIGLEELFAQTVKEIESEKMACSSGKELLDLLRDKKKKQEDFLARMQQEKEIARCIAHYSQPSCAQQAEMFKASAHMKE